MSKAKIEEIEAKVKAAMKFIGRSEQTAYLCGHRYDLGTMKRRNNQVTYNMRTGQIRICGNDRAWPRNKQRNVNRVIGSNSRHRSEALRAIFNSILPEVRQVGRRKMEQERLTKYLKSKNVPLSV